MSQKAAIIERIIELTANSGGTSFTKSDLVNYIKDHPGTIISKNRRYAKQMQCGNLVFLASKTKDLGIGAMKARIFKTLRELVDAGTLAARGTVFTLDRAPKKVRFSPDPPQVMKIELKELQDCTDENAQVIENTDECETPPIVIAENPSTPVEKATTASSNAPRPGWSGKRTLPAEEGEVPAEEVAAETTGLPDVNMLFTSVEQSSLAIRAQKMDRLAQLNSQIAAVQQRIEDILLQTVNKEIRDHLELKFSAKDFVTRNKRLVAAQDTELRIAEDTARQYERALKEQEAGVMYNREASRARRLWDQWQSQTFRNNVAWSDQYRLGASIFRRSCSVPESIAYKMQPLKQELSYLQQCQSELVQQL